MLVLTVKDGPDVGAEFRLGNEPRVIIGRGSPQFKLTDRMISHAHARLKQVDGQWLVRDVNSKNGTFVNGHRILGDTRLADGDEIKVGLTVLRFHTKPAETAATQPDALDLTIDSIEAFLNIPDDEPADDEVDDFDDAKDEVTQQVDQAVTDKLAGAAQAGGGTAGGGTDGSDSNVLTDSEMEPAAEVAEMPAEKAADVTVVVDAAKSVGHDNSDDGESSKPAKPAFMQPLPVPTRREVADDPQECIGALAFDQAAALTERDALDSDHEVNPAKMTSQESAAPMGDDESPDNQWQSVLNAVMSQAEGEGWEDESADEVLKSTPENDDAVAALLDELSREENSASEASDELPEDNDTNFADYLVEQQRIADAEPGRGKVNVK